MTQFLAVAALVPTMFFSGMAFWRPNPVFFILAGGCAFFNGLNWYDAIGTHEALAISLLLMIYAFLMWAYAFRYMFWRETD